MDVSLSSTSAEPNIRRITDTTPLHGLRTIFSISVVIYHTLLFLPLALDDAAQVNNLVSGSFIANMVAFIATLGNASVDIFLLISGFFLKRSFPSKPITAYTALRYTIFRYLRLAPAYLSIAFALRYFGDKKCIKPPEFFLVHLTNLSELCIFFGWSTNVDFVSHILLLPFLHRPKILAALIIVIPPLKLWKWYQRGTPMHPMPPTVLSFSENDEQLNFWSDYLAIPRGSFNPADPDLVSSRATFFAYEPLYFWLIYRIGAVIVGIFLYCAMRDKKTVYRLVRRFPTISVLCVTVLFGFFHVVEFELLTQHWAKMIHTSTGRILLPLGVSIIIMQTCSIDDYVSQHWICRFLRAVLSCRLFNFVHRFTYVVYLLQLGTGPVLGKFAPSVTNERVSPIWVVLMGMKWYLLTTVMGLPIWGVEWVALKGRRLLLRKVSDREGSDKDLEEEKAKNG